MKNFNDIKSDIERYGFDSVALRAFQFQAEKCLPYKKYIQLLGIEPSEVTSVDQIPFLPIEFFRSERIYCADSEPELEFGSSGTTGAETSTHYVASAELYTDSFMSGFRDFFGSESDYELRTMLPCYRPGSSLLYMIEELKKRCTGSKVILWGVTFALLEAAKEGGVRLPEGSIVIETGGMKGRGKAIEREELHRILGEGFGVERIGSEYGMCELLSQGYSRGEGLFVPSKTMSVRGRMIDSPLSAASIEEVCGLNIIDLANWYSCSFLATGDKGIIHSDGSFEVLGRIEGEILRGCNML